MPTAPLSLAPSNPRRMRPAGGSANPYTLPMSLMFAKSVAVEEVILSQTLGDNPVLKMRTLICCRCR